MNSIIRSIVKCSKCSYSVNPELIPLESWEIWSFNGCVRNYEHFIPWYWTNIFIYINIYITSAQKLLICKIPGWSIHVFLSKSMRYELTDFAWVMIDDVGCSRRHQCPQCVDVSKSVEKSWYRNCFCITSLTFFCCYLNMLSNKLGGCWLVIWDDTVLIWHHCGAIR